MALSAGNLSNVCPISKWAVDVLSTDSKKFKEFSQSLNDAEEEGLDEVQVSILRNIRIYAGRFCPNV